MDYPDQSSQLRAVVRALRTKGVRFPKRYPPKNLDPGDSHFPGVVAEIDVLVLLSQVLMPKLLELSDGEPGRDTDITVRTTPAYRLQVKGPLAVNVRAEYSIMEMVRSARREVLREFRHKYPTAWNGVFSRITITRGKEQEVSSGWSYSVDHPRRVHVAVVEIDNEVLMAATSRNLERWIRKSVTQMSGYTDALLVQVLNLSRYPVDQTAAYRFVKERLRHHPRWRDAVPGVLLVLGGYGPRDETTGLHSRRPRLVSVENPLAPPERRLNPKIFTKHFEEEEVFEERMVAISVEPLEPWRIMDGHLWVGETLFGLLPRPLGEPFMTVL